jgi:hypothetical protein
MSSAGQLLEAQRIPGETIGDPTVLTADSSTFTTTETQVGLSTRGLVSGRTYRVRFNAGWNSTVLGDAITARLREDTSSGNLLDSATLVTTLVSASRGAKVVLEAQFVASSTANKTFVATGQREAGTGSCRLAAATSRPAILEILYISG